MYGSVCFQCHPTTLCGLYSGTAVFFAEWILSTGRTGQSPARCSPRPPTLPPPGTMGITPRETIMARPENSIKLRARRVMMYVVPSILPHTPPPHSNVHTHIHAQKCLHCHACVLVNMNSYLWKGTFILSFCLFLIYSRLVTHAPSCSFFFGFVWLLHLFSSFSCLLDTKGESAKTNVI